jgi:hypothetical protein
MFVGGRFQLLDNFVSGETLTLRYTPDPNFNTPTGQAKPDNFKYVVENRLPEVFPWPFEERVNLVVIPANDAPGLVLQSTNGFCSEDGLIVTPATLYAVVSDDARPTDSETVTITASAAATQIVLINATGVATETFDDLSFQVQGTLAQLNGAFSRGIRVTPKTCGTPKQFPCNVTVNFLVADNGAFGEGPGAVPKTTTLSIFIPVQRSNTPSDEITTTASVGALVGVTTLMSLGMFGAYKIMKRRKLIPEEADPWENDELFDATLDNPLYSGATVTMNAVFDQEADE